MSILHEIYHETYEPCEPLRKIPKELLDRKWAFYEEVEKRVGIELIERHWDAICEADIVRDYVNFREGFRLGVSLMLEMIR